MVACGSLWKPLWCGGAQQLAQHVKASTGASYLARAFDSCDVQVLSQDQQMGMPNGEAEVAAHLSKEFQHSVYNVCNSINHCVFGPQGTVL